jgi:hypothetical protein
MTNFIIFFTEREGTSPLVRILSNFEQLDIIHQIKNSGWEPLDFHNCGPMSTKNLKICFDIIFNNEPLNLRRLNQVYTKTAAKPLAVFDKTKSIGFKMRFRHPKNLQPLGSGLPINLRYLNSALKMYRMQKFRKLVFNMLKKYKITAFVAVRQNTLRLALSDYHGDGHGNPGHLQFKLASGEISKDDIPKIRVDCDRLEQLISKWEQIHKHKKRLIKKFKRSGIKTHALLYETFCDDKQTYFQDFFSKLDLYIAPKDVATALKAGSVFKKVHSDDISEFVINHEEVLERFGDRAIGWHP